MDKCEVCGCSEWGLVYSGPIRDGVYSKNTYNSSVYQCKRCSVQRLLEKDCVSYDYYESGEYRKKLKQSINAEDVIQEHEFLNKFTFEALWPATVRNKSVVDIGCGSGSLLDYISGVSKNIVGIE